ncbi:MAG: AgmX/PglI C-terminal domain-containing protein [bacterium]
MYFKIYHKKTRQYLSTYNERAIVDFYLKNKENISNYYFIEGNTDKALDGEDFAYRYSELFDRKAQEREEIEQKKIHSTDTDSEDALEVSTKDSSEGISFVLWIFLFVFVFSLAFTVVYLYFFSGEEENKEAVKEKVEKRERVDYPLKRESRPDDKNLKKADPSLRKLKKAWKKADGDLPESLSSEMIKKKMDSFLPYLQECYENRIKAGDRNLRGTINMKIKVLGDGSVADLIFTSEKYRATLFGDCLRAKILSSTFPMFRGKKQVFSYYFTL